MLTDLFFKRYPERLWWQVEAPPWLGGLQVQLCHLFTSDLLETVAPRELFCRDIHDRVARELGLPRLADGRSYEEACTQFIICPYNLWNNSHGHSDEFFKLRLSLVELAFRTAEELVEKRQTANKHLGGLLTWRGGRSSSIEDIPERGKLASAIAELNVRLRDVRLPFHYNRGYIQRVDDPVTTEQIEESFWPLLDGTIWKNVDTDIKEALDRRDSGGRDAAFYAAKALESTIKIMSDQCGATTGKERGAADYIDNLARSSPPVIDDWETSLLKGFFSKVRNPHGHGPGSAAMPSLNQHQETWAIECGMSWIKSLIRRL